MTNLIIVAALAFSNFMIFLGLVFILIRAKRRNQESSFKITPVREDLNATEKIPVLSKTKANATVAMDTRPLIAGLSGGSEPGVNVKRANKRSDIPQEAGVR